LNYALTTASIEIRRLRPMRQIASAPIECGMLNLESLKGLWDALTGIGTVSMAVATLIVVRQARQDRKERDRHHRDSLRPICVLMPGSFSSQIFDGTGAIPNGGNV
jgi:hypothetical protein